MAIKIECNSCGFKNDLGRVFCMQCGKRLELTHTSLNDLASRRTYDWAPLVRRVLRVLAWVLIGGALGALVWPRTPSTVQVDRSGVQQIAMKERAVQRALRARQSVSITVTEAEANGFLDARARALGIQQLSIDFKPGSFTLAAARRWTPVPQVTVLTNVVIPVSHELKGRFEGGRLVIQGGRLGHVPLPSRVAALTTPWFRGCFDDQTGMVHALKSVTLDEAAAQLVFGP